MFVFPFASHVSILNLPLYLFMFYLITFSVSQTIHEMVKKIKVIPVTGYGGP
jgi:hypothetical protein